jgi:hypothetical protein
MQTGRISNSYYLIGILALCAALSLGSYLLASSRIYRIGFPLDDAWIHQTYARNLASTGSWAFLPGEPSAGSTAPGWSLLLALGYWLNLSSYLWTFLWGWVLLTILAVVTAFGFRILVPNHQEAGVWAGLLVIFEWHMTWAAGSGMETLLSALIALMVLLWAIRLEQRFGEDTRSNGWQWLGLGVLIGLSIWVRPDGITLLAVIGFTLILVKSELKNKLSSLLILGTGFLLMTVPYLIFNQVLAGEIWPNTFYAKQAEYAILRSTPYWQRLLNVSRQPLTGIGIVLLPGFIWFGIQAYRMRRWAKLGGALWVIGYLAIYAWRLPVIYQHGRYIMPVIPVYCLFGIAGLVSLLEIKIQGRWGRIFKRAWVVAAGVILAAFWILGGRAYALDVGVIESEMVEAAIWIADNTEEEALVAAHDIGALGFFADRNLIDLAGLVSPEVIPYIRDEIALRNHLNERGADYLMTFPGWYSTLVSEKVKIYQSNGRISPEMGGENMNIYEWGNP